MIMFIGVIGVWDDVPVLGAYPILEMKGEYIPLFRYLMLHFKNCLHFY